MQAGELKNTITIKRDSSDGTTAPTWTALFTGIRAKREQASGRLFYAAAASQSENQVVYTIRYCTGIKPTMQLIDSKEPTSPYEIIGDPIDVDNAHQWLEIHVKRVSANGG
jgi:SPP1 family predicted phage head-tail adaptor